MVTTKSESPPPAGSFRAQLHQIIFEADTPAGRAFDVVLIGLIVVSILVVSIETIPTLPERLRNTLVIVEWAFTAIFTLEYVLRLTAVGRPLAYATSFFGVVDLIALLP